MSTMFKHQAWIVVVGLVVFFWNLGAAALFDMDEALYASCAREMAQRGDWVVPWFNGQMFPDKPPLMFWLMMLGTAVFGSTEFAVRAPSALFALGTALATYHIGRRLFRAEVGLWAGVIVSTSIIFTVSARAATVDSALTFAITAAIWVFVADGIARRNAATNVSDANAPDESSWTALVPRHALAFAVMYALIGVAVLAKGPVGLIMPAGAIGLFLLMVHRPSARAADDPGRFQGILARWWASCRAAGRLLLPWPALRWTWRLSPLWTVLGRLAPRRILTATWRLRPLTALAVLAVVALPWYVLVSLRTDNAWLIEFLGKYNIGAATNAPLMGHERPWFFHILLVFVGFFPWSVFLGPTVVEAWRRIRDDHPWRLGYVLAGCWAVFVIGLWSAVAMKLPHHVLPAYPALALLTGAFVYTWIAEHERMNRWWMRNAAITLVIVGAGIVVALPLVAAWVLPGEGAIGLVGLTLVAGGAAAWFFSERRRPMPAMVSFAAASVAFLVATFGVAVLRVDRHQTSPVLAAHMREANPGRLELASFRFFRQSFVYYSGEPVAELDSVEEIEKFLRRTERPFVITTDEHEAQLRGAFPGQFRVLTRQPRFLDGGELVVLARQEDQTIPQTARRGDNSQH
ncbi:MAG: glycosyltransferase family 39 protein [Pirellulales bacterium]|nr:glycosyltransferase family 39 protein [Pirellulales bacterium]